MSLYLEMHATKANSLLFETRSCVFVNKFYFTMVCYANTVCRVHCSVCKIRF